MDTVSTVLTAYRPEYAIASEGNGCSICFENFSVSDQRKIVAIECQHLYHEGCIKPWFEDNANCPLCRSEVNIHNLKTESIISNTEKTENTLVTACRLGDIGLILEQHANDSSILSHQYWSNNHGVEVPLILIAIENNQTELVRQILLLCPDAINQRTVNGTNALIMAARVGQVSLAMQLLESGADVNCLNAEGYSPLHIASFYGHSQFVDFLIKNHANIDALDQYHRTPLMVACWRGHFDVVQKLTANGCNLNQQTAYGQVGAFTLALEKGHLAIASLLMEKNVPVTHRDLYILGRRTDSSDLFIAVLNRLKGSLSDDDFDRIINGDPVKKISPLRDCAKNGTANSVDELVKHGAKLEAKGPSGHTAMYLAAVNGHLPVVERLLKHGADTNVALNSGLPMLLATINAGHTAVATALAKCPVTNINQDFQGKTPLSKCVITENGVDVELLETLLTRGAEIEVGDITPLAVAILSHPTDILGIMIKHLTKEQTNNPVLSLAETKYILLDGLEHPDPLLESYYDDLKNEDPTGMRPLSLAVFGNKIEAVKMLVGAGAYIAATDLQLARCRLNNSEMITFLESELLRCDNAHSSSPAEENYTPVATAIMRGLSGQEVISKLDITKKGNLRVDDTVVAPVQARELLSNKLSRIQGFREYFTSFSRHDSKGMRPLTLAVLCQNQQVIESLIEAKAPVRANDYRLAELVKNETIKQLLYQQLPEDTRKRLAKSAR